MFHNQMTRRGACRLLAGAAGATVLPCRATTAGTALPDWREGMLDIHHIATGRGESTFMMFPDGTTMLIDAGDMSGSRADETVLPVLPDASRTPGEWIAAYVGRFFKPLNRAVPSLDYVLLSHFHRDHIGGRNTTFRMAHGYALSGITEVAEHVGIGKLVDRGWPDYAFPSREATAASNPKFFNDYLAFVEHQRSARKTAVEGFAVGSASQFAMRGAAGRYPSFSVANVAANAKVGGREIFTRERKPDENLCSCAIKVSYGAFAYYTGGDLSGHPAGGKRDMETPVAEAVGRVDVLKANHHACADTMSRAFLAALRPRVAVACVWDNGHVNPDTFARMTDPDIYPGERRVYVTGLHEKTAERLGATGAAAVRPCGHVVVRVAEGGSTYRMLVLDPGTFTVRHDSGAIGTGA
jgi:beta-lactamase superfamily II metal-dependent hydrolase